MCFSAVVQGQMPSAIVARIGGGKVDRSFKAGQFRERARGLRNAALELESHEGREALLVMADEYDRMALEVDKTGLGDRRLF